MSKPIKEYSLGKCKAAIFKGDYNGNPTYSVKFQKSYKSGEEWKNTDYFSMVDLRELLVLVSFILDKQVKERTPKQDNYTEFAKKAVDCEDEEVPF